MNLSGKTQRIATILALSPQGKIEVNLQKRVGIAPGSVNDATSRMTQKLEIQTINQTKKLTDPLIEEWIRRRNEVVYC